MTSREPYLSRAAVWLTLAASVAIMVSIASFNILMGIALAALLFSGDRMRLPRIKWAFALFMLGTLISMAFSGEAAHALPQIRKFYLYIVVPLTVFSCLRDAKWLRWLFLAWAGLGSLEALRGFVQFAAKVREAHAAGQSFYDYYVSARITGFTSHWNTYAAEEMFALIMIGAFLFFAPGASRRLWLWIAAAALVAAAILLSDTRGVWIATFVAGLYLVWYWNKKLILLVPVAAILIFFASPPAIRERFVSIVHPKEEDSNSFRKIAWRSGFRMIEAHPWLGLGPDGPKYHFMEYIPPDVPRPLPSGFYEHVHNVYIQYAADRGIPTALVFLWILIQIPVDFWRGLRTLPPGRSNRRWLLHGGIAVVLAAMVEGFVEVNLGDSEVLTMFLIVMACGYLALEKEISLE
jgi:putative inorganic carbon (HCO3(-)) transporter